MDKGKIAQVIGPVVLNLISNIPILMRFASIRRRRAIGVSGTAHGMTWSVVLRWPQPMVGRGWILIPVRTDSCSCWTSCFRTDV